MKWSAPIPQKPKNKHRKRCYTAWREKIGIFSDRKVVWLTDAQMTFARIKYPHIVYVEVLEKDRLENYKKYLDATIE